MFMRRMAGAWAGLGYDRVGEPAGMTPGAPQSQAKGEVRFSNTLDPVAYSFIYKWDPMATWSLNFNIENFTKGMAVRVQLANTANPDGVEFRFEDSEPAANVRQWRLLDTGREVDGLWI